MGKCSALNTPCTLPVGLVFYQNVCFPARKQQECLFLHFLPFSFPDGCFKYTFFSLFAGLRDQPKRISSASRPTLSPFPFFCTQKTHSGTFTSRIGYTPDSPPFLACEDLVISFSHARDCVRLKNHCVRK